MFTRLYQQAKVLLANTLERSLSILYTPGQIMAALSISKQQWRTYRQALPRLNADGGRSACFSAGELLATAVVRTACETLQMPVSRFTSVANSLYEVCESYPWIRLERSYIALLLDEGRANLLDLEQLPACELAIIIHLQSVVAGLRESFLTPRNSSQHELAFLPMIAGSHP
jgi:hypothetical protein